MYAKLILLLFTGCLFANSCPEVSIVDRSGKGINQRDLNSVRFNKKRCVKIYPKSPCLVRFEKLAEQTYRAYCGKAGK